MANKILNAEVADVKIGDAVRTEGLKIEDGRYGITVAQTAILFSVRQDNAQRDFKAILGESFQFVKIRAKRAERQNRAENALITEQLSDLILPLVLKGNKTAILLAQILIGVSIEQFWADGFGDNLTKENRQELANRIMSKSRKFHPLFGEENCNRVASFLGCSRQSFKMANWWNTFVYFTLTPQEWCDLNERNPIINGRRKECIHQWLNDNAVDNHKEVFDKLLLIVELARSEKEFQELFRRKFYGDAQLVLF